MAANSGIEIEVEGHGVQLSPPLDHDQLPTDQGDNHPSLNVTINLNNNNSGRRRQQEERYRAAVEALLRETTPKKGRIGTSYALLFLSLCLMVALLESEVIIQSCGRHWTTLLKISSWKCSLLYSSFIGLPLPVDWIIYYVLSILERYLSLNKGVYIGMHELRQECTMYTIGSILCYILHGWQIAPPPANKISYSKEKCTEHEEMLTRLGYALYYILFVGPYIMWAMGMLLILLRSFHSDGLFERVKVSLTQEWLIQTLSRPPPPPMPMDPQLAPSLISGTGPSRHIDARNMMILIRNNSPKLYVKRLLGDVVANSPLSTLRQDGFKSIMREEEAVAWS